MMKPPLILKRVIMQANNLNRLLDNKETPRTAIEYNAYELTQSLEELRNSTRKMNPTDIDTAIAVLKKAKRRLEEYEKENDHD